VVTPEAFNAGKWTLIGPQYKYYFVTLPKQEFSLYDEYEVDDEVFYKDKVYICLRPVTGIAPDTEDNNYWNSGTAYSVSAATLPTDATKWTAGDNRTPMIRMLLIDIMAYHLFSRISPNNISELRVKRYDDAIKWLKNAAKGDDLTLGTSKIEPHQGARLRMGSVLPKQNNSL